MSFDGALTVKVFPSKVNADSPVNAFAPVAVITLLSEPFAKVGFPDAVPVNAPTNVVAVITPVELALFKTKVAALFTVTDVPLPIGDILSTLNILLFFCYLLEGEWFASMSFDINHVESIDTSVCLPP